MKQSNRRSKFSWIDVNEGWWSRLAKMLRETIPQYRSLISERPISQFKTRQDRRALESDDIRGSSESKSTFHHNFGDNKSISKGGVIDISIYRLGTSNTSSSCAPQAVQQHHGLNVCELKRSYPKLNVTNGLFLNAISSYCGAIKRCTLKLDHIARRDSTQRND